MLIVLIGVAIGSVAAYLLKDLDARINTQRASSDSLRDRAVELSSTMAEIRAAQVAYVARGQGEGFWMGHVASLLALAEKQAADFDGTLTAPNARSIFGSVAAALQNFRTIDGRVREFVVGGNSLLAADLIFSDSLESTATASAQLTAALNEELQVVGGHTAAMRRRQASIAVAAGASLVALMLVLGFSGSLAGNALQSHPAAPVIEPVRFEAPLPRAKPAITPKLLNTAQLCSELARVSDGTQLTHLLERTARVLDASGIIVWVADAAGRELRPAMAHGYTDQVMAKMGGILREANNAAAAAYRSAEIRTVAGDNGANGAVIAPLLTADGCIGVLSAELKGGSEKDESSQALAAIFAAQLATLVSPPAAAAPVRAAAHA
jgi:hypothetical protein